MSDGTPTPYAELAAVVEALPLLVRERRRALGIGVREAGRQLGLSPSSVARIERDGDFNSRCLPAVLRWLGAR